MRFLSLFSGIGAPEKALTNMGIPVDLVGYCEIDKYASKSYAAIHGVDESMNLGDITKVDEKALPKDIDLCCYGFPCQDISLAGKQKGLFNEDGTQTRSGLFFEALRIIEATQPRVAIAENVKNLVGKKFNAQFQIVLASLEAAGYNNYWKVLNAKDFGIPQNRERVFIVSIRKDIDNGEFKFPEGFPLKLRLKDVLEDEVDEKYFVKKELPRELGVNSKAIKSGYSEAEVRQIGNCCPTKTRDNPNQGRIYDTEGLAPCLNQMEGGNRQPFVVQKVGNIYPSGGQNGNVYSTDGLSPTILSGETNTKGNGGIGSSNAPKIVVEPTWSKNKDVPLDYYIESAIKQNIDIPCAVDQQNVLVRKDNLVGTITTNGSSAKRNNRVIVEKDSDLRIRKLTPKECFRLMGFDDESFHRAEAVNSNTQLYKQAGNSIVVDVLEHLIQELLNCGALEGDNT